MRLSVRLDGRVPRRWHLRLIERIVRQSGMPVSVEATPGPGALPSNAALLFRLEAMLRRLPANGPSAPIARTELDAVTVRDGALPDLILDLCGDVEGGPNARVWRVAYDGVPGEAALLAALLAGRMPIVTLTENGRSLASGRIGTEARGIMLTAFEDSLVRTMSLILAALAGPGPRLAQDTILVGGMRARAGQAEGFSAWDLGARAARLGSRMVARRLRALCIRDQHWRVGWRRLSGPDLVDLRAHPESGWHALRDDGLRFYADPFPIADADGTVLFVEDYVYGQEKGLISAVRFGPDGPVGTPVPVLEAAHHLSYPFVFAQDGAYWMVPESGTTGTLDLYRSTAFPGGWIKDSTLIAGLNASDPTLLKQGERWWLFASVRDDGERDGPFEAWGSYSDSLHLWSAPDFRGPWTAHARNPVLIDIASARSGGRIIARAGALIRPVQDCRTRYGGALGLARIERLDEAGYVQRVETVLRPGPRFPGHGLHTLNRARDLEFIDGAGRVRRRFETWT
ncbi:formyl transferase [Methylobacterium sp. J-068]|uniref:glucosamine inositolphosphorylceramide transferase family protein n=1 Tax=Methylobacterium sp. J-068 TaxID=2836649 RepID=UPI001FB9C526|nr:formyl transferase [Methylobacterium sp. J-068]MCJ2033937.1 formyl transferase [Methylobacterium sp. J-068]